MNKLVYIMVILAAVSGPENWPWNRPPVAPVVPNQPINDDMIGSLNQYRKAAGVPVVRRDARLDRTASAQAAYCARIARLTHTGPGNSNPWSRMKAAGVPYPGMDAQENGAAWQRDGAQAVADWAHENPDIGHRRNVYDRRWTHAGYGISKDSRGRKYYFMDFAREP